MFIICTDFCNLAGCDSEKFLTGANGNINAEVLADGTAAVLITISARDTP